MRHVTNQVHTCPANYERYSHVTVIDAHSWPRPDHNVAHVCYDWPTSCEGIVLQIEMRADPCRLCPLSRIRPPIRQLQYEAYLANSDSDDSDDSDDDDSNSGDYEVPNVVIDNIQINETNETIGTQREGDEDDEENNNSMDDEPDEDNINDWEDEHGNEDDNNMEEGDLAESEDEIDDGNVGADNESDEDQADIHE